MSRLIVHLPDEDVARIAGVYHAWRQGAASSEEAGGGYADVPGFCKSAPLEEVRRHGHVLTPGRYVGAEPREDDGEPFEAKMTRLVAELRAQQAEGARLDAAIAENLERLGFGWRDGTSCRTDVNSGARTTGTPNARRRILWWTMQES